MDLYDMDLSLFGGDLLMGLEPTSAELKATQDVQKSSDLTSSWASTDLDVSLGQDELGTATSVNTSVADRPLETAWMDSRIDLLDLLAQEGEYALETNAGVTRVMSKDGGVVVENNAVKVLQDMAEETSQMLAAGSPGEPELEEAVVAQAAADNLQYVVQTEDGPTSVDQLLDILTTGIDPTVVDVNLNASTTVEDIPIDSDILTSVTAEDVESILSSEPSSPAAPNAFSFSAPLPPDQSNSLLAHYLLSDLGAVPSTSSSGGSNSQMSPVPFDASDLESISDAQTDDDDSDYVPSSYRVSKTRATPYARSKPKSGGPKSKSAVDKEARALDRKMRKKQQNKDAATRYRQKKREEADLIDQECDELEARNSELKDKVDQMTREIGYLKNLLAEVYKARGLMAPKLGK